MSHSITIIKDSNARVFHFTTEQLQHAPTPEGEWREYSRAQTTCGESITAPTAGLVWQGTRKDLTCAACLRMINKPTPSSARTNRTSQYGRNSRKPQANKQNYTLTGLKSNT